MIIQSSGIGLTIGGVNMNIFKFFQQPVFYQLLQYFLPHKRILVGIALSLAVFSLVDAGMIYFIKPLIDDGLASSNSSVLRTGSILVIAIFLIRGIASFAANYGMAYVSNNITYTIRNQAFTHLMTLPKSYFSQVAKGKIISKITYDAEQLSKATADTLVILVRELLIIVVLLAIMFYASWQLSLIFLVLGPMIAWVIKKVSRRFKKISRNVQDVMGELTSASEQAINNHQDILCLRTGKVESQRFCTINNRNRRQMMKLASASAISSPVVQLISSFAIASILFIASIDGIIENISAGTFTTTLVAMGSLLRPLKQLTKVNFLLQRGLAAAESLFELLNEKAELDQGSGIKSTLTQQISIKELSFGYPNAEGLALKKVDLSIKKNSFTAIVGPSGSGKSTIAQLLMRLYPVAENKIIIDDAPIETLKLTSLRSMFSLVSQNIQLIDDTISANIRYGLSREVTEQELETVAKVARVWDFAQNLPEKLDASVGENGCLLSGGQRQRISIARALLSQTPILILDEATSALDALSERAIEKALQDLQGHKTIILIAHRLSTVKKADQILVLSDGEIIERGDHSHLLSQQGIYYQMCKQQGAATIPREQGHLE